LGVTCLVFAGFMVWNGGVAVGDRELQQPGWNPTHGWFFLALFALLFAPQCVEGIRQVWNRERSYRMRAALLALAASALFGATFCVRHPFNQMNQSYVLHNILLCAVATMPVWRVLSLLVPPFALAGLLLSPLAQERYRWWVVLALVPLMWIPHVDTRYDMVPLVLFLVLRAPASRAVEVGMTIAYVALALWINAVSFGFVYYP